MTEPLTLKYRPQMFDDMVGQRLTSVVLKQMVTKDAIDTGLLFDGPRGTGKTSAARILAMELNPDQREQILNGSSLAVIEIDAASHGSVADIRALTDQLKFSVGARKRVVIIDEAHAVTRDGFNALLKTLEEPPANTVFILVTTEPNKIPETVKSRLMEFEFRRVAPIELLERIVAVAKSEDIEVDDALARKLAEVADGSVRDAIKGLDFVHRAEIKTVEDYVELTGEKDVGPLLLAAMLTNDHAKIFSIFDHVMLEVGDPRTVSTAINNAITDLFVLKSGGEVTAAGEALDRRLKLAKLIPLDNLYSATTVLWDLKTKVRWIEDQRAALATAVILMSNKLSAGRTVTPDVTPEPVVASEMGVPHVLSLDEMMQS